MLSAIIKFVKKEWQLVRYFVHGDDTPERIIKILRLFGEIEEKVNELESLMEVNKNENTVA